MIATAQRTLAWKRAHAAHALKVRTLLDLDERHACAPHLDLAIVLIRNELIFLNGTPLNSSAMFKIHHRVYLLSNYESGGPGDWLDPNDKFFCSKDTDILSDQSSIRMRLTLIFEGYLRLPLLFETPSTSPLKGLRSL